MKRAVASTHPPSSRGRNCLVLLPAPPGWALPPTGESGPVAISRAVADRRWRGQVRRVEESDVDVTHGRRVQAASSKDLGVG